MVTKFLLQSNLLQSGGERLKTLLFRWISPCLPFECSHGDSSAVISEQISDVVEALNAISRQVEPDFLQLGSELQSVHADATALSQRTLNAMAVIGSNDEEGVLKKINRTIHESFTNLESHLSKGSANLSRLVDGVGLMGELYNQCPVIEKMALELRVIGLNIGIESARTPDARELFSLVAVEVRTLSETIATIAENIRNGSLEARQHQQTAHREISSSLTELTTVAEGAEQAVHKAAERIEHLVMRSLEAMDRASAHSHDITGRVGQVVVGIQFHDNMSQRIEHITAALKDVIELVHEAGSVFSSQTEQAPLWGRAHSIVDIQIAQLKQVITEINDVYRENLHAFDIIINRVNDLVQSLSWSDDISAFDQVPEEMKTADGPLRAEKGAESFLTLKAALESFRDLLAQGGHFNSRIQETFAHAAAAVEDLAGHAATVRRINSEIHIISLNAIVKAAHMGDKGRSMEVLAQAVKGLADQSNISVAAVNTLLDNIIATIHTRLDTEEESKALAMDVTGNAMAEGIAQIAAAYETLTADSVEIRERAEALTKITAGTRERLGFMTALLDQLKRYLLELEEIGALIDSRVIATGADASAEAARLAARYTMDQERIIHEKRLGHKDGGTAAAIESPVPKEAVLPPHKDRKDFEFDDNIELF